MCINPSIAASKCATSSPSKPSLSSSSSSSAIVGDIAHVLCVANTLLFAYTVVMHNDNLNIFDHIWQPDGFCVTNKDVPYMNSHDLCFYFDTAAALLFGLIYLSLYKTPGMDVGANKIVNVFSIVGVLGHGIIHGATGKGIRDGIDTERKTGFETMDIEGMDMSKRLIVLSPLFIFWISLLKASMPQASLTKIVLPMAAIVVYMGLLTPAHFGFTYTQTVLLVAFSMNQLLRPVQEKDFSYMLYPLLVGIPLSFIGWLESTACSKGVIDFGGHLLYDAYIPISMFIYYIICYMKTTGSNKVKTI